MALDRLAHDARMRGEEEGREVHISRVEQELAGVRLGGLRTGGLCVRLGAGKLARGYVAPRAGQCGRSREQPAAHQEVAPVEAARLVAHPTGSQTAAVAGLSSGTFASFEPSAFIT